jgi:hypothetical protein
MPSSSDAARAFLRGWARVVRAPLLVAGVWVVMVLTALPAALAVHRAIADQLGSSLVGSRVARGADYLWQEEFRTEARGIASTFDQAIVGAAAPLRNWSDLVDGELVPAPLIATVAVGLAAWLFLTGGAVDRLARGRAVGTRAFFGACGTFFFRFLRLGVLAGMAYLLLVGPCHRALFDWFYPWVTRDTSAERVAFAWRLVVYAAWLLPVSAVNVVVDYAKVRAVIEDRRSMVGAVAAGFRFARRHPAAVLGIYAGNSLVLAVAFSLYLLAAPGVNGGDWRMLVALGAGQAWILARIVTKLAFLATAAALVQDRLAHAEYTAAPLPVWPDSPAAEAIENAVRYGVRPEA